MFNQPERERKIDYLEIPVTDLTLTKDFYGKIFSWTFQDWGPEYATFSDGRFSGGFRLERTVATGGPLIIIHSSDLESVEQQIRAAGGTITKEIFSFPGGRRFHFTDPSGNELSVWTDTGDAGSL